MGIFDRFRDRKRIRPLRSALNRYHRDLREGREEAIRVTEALLGDLTERETSVLLAADAGLIPIPARLASRVAFLRERREVWKATEASAEETLGVAADAAFVATDFLIEEPWWPEFVSYVRDDLHISDEHDIGRWGTHGKQIAPLVWECGFTFQTPEAADDDGPINVWTWRVDLKARTSVAI